jgi:YD repeat-containing protein
MTGGYTFLKTVNYYDDRGRVIQLLADNLKMGTDVITNVYDFAGKVLKTKTTHVERDVTWTNKFGIQLIGNKFTDVAANSGFGNSGSTAVQQLGAGLSGWVEVTFSENNKGRLVRWTDQTNLFQLYLNNGSMYIQENSTINAIVPGVVAGDVFRMDRTGSTISYRKNGALIFTSSLASTTAITMTTLLNEIGSTLVGIRSSFTTTSHTIVRRLVYDHMGRPLQTFHSLDGAAEVLLTQNEYDEKGELIDKKLHSTNNGMTFRQSIDYRYNIRGWLTKMNESDLSAQDAGDARDYFGMQLSYNDDLSLGATLQYNGNISAMKWSTNLGLASKKERAYTYNYDATNRILGATFKVKKTTWNLDSLSAYSESGYSYDQNGNISGLTRKGLNGASMDVLTYDYGAPANMNNRLLSVTDAGDATLGFNDGNTSGNDYGYDSNGNMTADLNKSVYVQYNYLNLPTTVTKGLNTMNYVYDAAGRKLAQNLLFGMGEKDTDYVGEFVYEDDALQFATHEEGRVALATRQTVFASKGENVNDGVAVSTTVTTTTATI